MSERIRPPKGQSPERIQAELKKTISYEEAARKALSPIDLERDIKEFFAEHAEFVSSMLNAGIENNRTRGQRDSIIRTTNNIISGDIGLRHSSEVTKVRILMDEKLEELREKERKTLSDFYDRTQPLPDTDEYIDFTIELGTSIQNVHASEMFYGSLEMGHLPGKKAEEDRFREGLSDEQRTQRKQRFSTISQAIKAKITHEEELGKTEGLAYLLGEDNAIAELVRETK